MRRTTPPIERLMRPSKEEGISMTELAVYQPQGELVLTSSSAMERAADFATWAPKLTAAAAIAAEIANTDFVPGALRRNTAAVTAAILAGSEMNLGPMASLMHVHIIDGRPSLSSEMQRALVLGLGHHIRYVEMTTARCVVEGQRRGESDWTAVTWTMDDAKRAGLASRQQWQKYPRRMLAARATSELCRMLFADALAGMPFSAEELEDEADDVATIAGSAATSAPAQRTARRRQPVPENVPGPAEPNGSSETPVSPAEPGASTLPPLPGEDEPDPAPEPDIDKDAPGTATVGTRDKPGQLTAFWACMQNDFGFKAKEKDQARAVIETLIGRQLANGSSGDLSWNEARMVLDTLANWKLVAEAEGRQPREVMIAGLAEHGGEPEAGDPGE